MSASISSRLSTLLLEHSARYPYLQVQDVYKLLYQACMGSGHAVSDLDGSLAMLKTEINELEPDQKQPLIEKISPEPRMDRKVVRVNLRPYMAATSDLAPLLDVHIRTSNTFEGSLSRLEQFAGLLSQVPVPYGTGFSQKVLIQFMEKMGGQNYPAIHHSQIYAQFYRPAYRVVAVLHLAPILEVCRMK